MVQKPMLRGKEGYTPIWYKSQCCGVKKERVARATDKVAIELVEVGGVSGYEITSKAIRVIPQQEPTYLRHSLLLPSVEYPLQYL